MIDPEGVNGLARSMVIGGWIAIGAAYLQHRLRHRPGVRAGDPESTFGLGLQGAAFGIAWGVDRPALAPLGPGDPLAVPAFAAVALLTAVSAALVWWALLSLGADWAAHAELRGQHELVTHGPYARVRHPLYTGMLGLLLATAAVVTRWPAVPVVVALYTVGTAVRVRSEERALETAHGDEFRAYRRRVPAVVPRPWRRR